MGREGRGGEGRGEEAIWANFLCARSAADNLGSQAEEEEKKKMLMA